MDRRPYKSINAAAWSDILTTQQNWLLSCGWLEICCSVVEVTTRSLSPEINRGPKSCIIYMPGMKQ